MPATASSQPSGRDAQREEMLEQAAQILARDGMAGLSLRKLAEACGTSTMAVYSLFGGKDGLLDALYLATMEGLGHALQAVPPHPDPMVWLAELGLAYRAHSLAHPALYGIIAGASLAHGRVEASNLKVRSGYQTLKRAVERLLAERDHWRRYTPDLVADVLWSVVHGVVSLELNGHFATPEAAEAVLRHNSAAVVGHMLAEMEKP
jgi:AcrR family transcriptional regulator